MPEVAHVLVLLRPEYLPEDLFTNIFDSCPSLEVINYVSREYETSGKSIDLWRLRNSISGIFRTFCNTKHFELKIYYACAQPAFISIDVINSGTELMKYFR